MPRGSLRPSLCIGKLVQPHFLTHNPLLGPPLRHCLSCHRLDICCDITGLVSLSFIMCCRYSKGYMPIANLFRNCSYYWVFAAFVSYFINHPLYTPPPITRSAVALSLAMICQLCNLR